MRGRFAVLLLLLAACRTPPLDYDGGVPGGFGDLAPLPGGARDLASVPDLRGSPTSCCGVPGNPGNELGVGKFCNSAAECRNQPANLCAATFSPNLHFCTRPCMMGGGGCGSGAMCQCAGSGQCACVPGECVQPPPGC